MNTGQFNVNQFNSLISQASDAIMCNSDCRKKRQTATLKQDLINAQTNLASAPSQLQTSEKNYVTFTQGTAAYNEMLQAQLEEKAKQIATTFTENITQEAEKIHSQIDTYNGLLINVKNVHDLFRQLKKENIQLFKEFKEETNDILTNERKTYYEDQNIGNLNSFYYYMLLGVYIIIVICFGAFSQMYPSQSSWKSRLGIFIGLLILPFFSTRILGMIIYIVYEIYYLLPKNVYRQTDY